MKKTFLILSSSLLLALSGLSFSNSSIEAKADEQTIEYIDFGPGVFNPNQSGTPEELYRPDVYSLAYRNDAFMFFPNKNVYGGITTNTVCKASDYIDSDFSFIRIYTSETEYKTIDYYFDGSNAVKYNIYADASINFALFTREKALESNDIYKVVINEGFVLPYPVDDHSVKYVVKETLTFVNTNYQHLADNANITYSFEWDKKTYTDYEEEELIEDRIPIAAFARKDEDYRLQIRGAHITEEDFKDPSRLDIDDGTCRLLIFFGENDYNSELVSTYVNVPYNKFDVSEDNPDSYIHKLYEKILFHTPAGETLTLKDVANPEQKGLPTFNVYGERGSISFVIGNNGDDSIPNYNAYSFSSVTMLRGAEFPSYRYTSGSTDTEIRYVQMDDITVELSAYKYAKWSTYAEYVFTAANITVDAASARHVNINEEEFKLDATVIDLKLSECNYEGITNAEIYTINENLTRYIYVNGRALYYKYDINDLRAFANLDGKEDTISIAIPMELSEINEIIVRRGCSVPSLVASTITMEIYGGYVSYLVSTSASFEYKNNEFVAASTIYWTLWFEGKNPIRVANLKTYDIDSAPKGESNNKQTFLNWVDEEGEDISGYIRITSGREFTGKYSYSYDVNFKNIDKEFSVLVKRYTRLTEFEGAKAAISPTRKGFVFQGYVDEEGNHFNLNNRVVRDMTLTAVWVAVEDDGDDNSSNKCGGNIATTSIMLTTISLFGIVLLTCFKTRKYK